MEGGLTEPVGDAPKARSERRIEVERAKDGRIVVASLGGGMPVAIRLSEDEAVAVRARIDEILAAGPARTEP